jgi:hypothetical protein
MQRFLSTFLCLWALTGGNVAAPAAPTEFARYVDQKMAAKVLTRGKSCDEELVLQSFMPDTEAVYREISVLFKQIREIRPRAEAIAQETPRTIWFYQCITWRDPSLDYYRQMHPQITVLFHSDLDLVEKALNQIHGSLSAPQMILVESIHFAVKRTLTLLLEQRGERTPEEREGRLWYVIRVAASTIRDRGNRQKWAEVLKTLGYKPNYSGMALWEMQLKTVSELEQKGSERRYRLMEKLIQ